MSNLIIKALITFIFLVFPLYEFLLQSLSNCNIKNRNNILYLFYVIFLFLSNIKFYFVIGMIIFSILLLINDYRNNNKNTANLIIPIIFLCFLLSNLFSSFITNKYGLNLFTGYLPVYLYIIVLFIFFIFAINYLLKIILLITKNINKKV